MDVIHSIVIILFSVLLIIITLLGLNGPISIKFRYIIFLAIIIRITLIGLFYYLIHYDSISYRLIGNATLHGLNIYPSEAYKYHPYLPFLLYIEAISIYISKFGLHYMIFLKIFFSLFDLINIYLVHVLSNKNSRATLLYAFNPGLIFLSSVHGQIDSLPITLILLAILFFENKKEYLSAFFLGISILVETWPLLFLAIFFKYSSNKKIYIFYAMLFPLLSIFIYSYFFHVSIFSIIRPILSYRGGYGSWGLGIITGLFIHPSESVLLLSIKFISSLTIIGLSLFFLFKPLDTLRKDILLFILIFSVILISGANPIWLLPFLIILRPKNWEFWLLLITFYSSLGSIIEIMNPLQISLSYLLSEIEISLAFLMWIQQIRILMTYNNKEYNFVDQS